MTHNGGRGCQNNQNNAVIPDIDACLLIIEFLSPHFDFIFGLPIPRKGRLTAADASASCHNQAWITICPDWPVRVFGNVSLATKADESVKHLQLRLQCFLFYFQGQVQV
jgi:hypothetical protein